MSTVAYARYTRIIHSRQCCNLQLDSIVEIGEKVGHELIDATR